MKRMVILLFAPVLLMAMIFIGCQGDSPVSSFEDFAPLAGALSLPNGATLESATLNVFAFDVNGGVVNVHRITAGWDEMTVTYNSFGNAYDAAVIGSFTASVPGYYMIDVTTTMQAWLDGTYDNFGLLLEQGEMPYTRYFSSEYDNPNVRPFLEICYSMGGTTDCLIVKRGINGFVEDTYVTMQQPDVNLGGLPSFFTGLLNNFVKEALIKFDMEVVVEMASLGDTVWYDVNRNGIQDGDELGVVDVTVHLFDCDDVMIATTATDENGFYIFEDLVPGGYYVKFIAPDGFYFTMQDQGADDAVDSDADPTTGMTICTILASDEHDMTWDAGLYSIPMEGCTRTKGYWKTHAGFGPQGDVVSQYLPITLGTGGGKSIVVSDNQIAYDILTQKVYGVPSNGITKLYAQLLAAKLNIAAEADFSVIVGDLADADAFLAMYDWTDWDSFDKTEKKAVNNLKSTFDEYNNGYIGPGHCDEGYNGGDDD